ncbi:MAG: M23 family metallopeptidase, partial [Acidimicrobiia bacterium]|nr:M23 family metallopeptidase [Acidimicrobiia bacterium]
MDYATAPGTEVRAAADGEVVFAGQVGGTLHVVVLHGDGIRTSATRSWRRPACNGATLCTKGRCSAPRAPSRFTSGRGPATPTSTPRCSSPPGRRGCAWCPTASDGLRASPVNAPASSTRWSVSAARWSMPPARVPTLSSGRRARPETPERGSQGPRSTPSATRRWQGSTSSAPWST